MLPSKSCGIGQCLRVDSLSCKWATNLLEDKVRMLLQRLEVDMNLLHQCSKSVPLMVGGDFPPRPAPEPFAPIGVGVLGRWVDQPQVVAQLGQHLAHQLRPGGGMGPQIIGPHKRQAPPGARPGHGRPFSGRKRHPPCGRGPSDRQTSPRTSRQAQSHTSCRWLQAPRPRVARVGLSDTTRG